MPAGDFYFVSINGFRILFPIHLCPCVSQGNSPVKYQMAFCGSRIYAKITKPLKLEEIEFSGIFQRRFYPTIGQYLQRIRIKEFFKIFPYLKPPQIQDS
jgi:hypothetical protein